MVSTRTPKAKYNRNTTVLLTALPQQPRQNWQAHFKESKCCKVEVGKGQETIVWGGRKEGRGNLLYYGGSSWYSCWNSFSYWSLYFLWYFPCYSSGIPFSTPLNIPLLSILDESVSCASPMVQTFDELEKSIYYSRSCVVAFATCLSSRMCVCPTSDISMSTVRLRRIKFSYHAPDDCSDRLQRWQSQWWRGAHNGLESVSRQRRNRNRDRWSR